MQTANAYLFAHTTLFTKAWQIQSIDISVRKENKYIYIYTPEPIFLKFGKNDYVSHATPRAKMWPFKKGRGLGV